jgi:hypothetical protein
VTQTRSAQARPATAAEQSSPALAQAAGAPQTGEEVQALRIKLTDLRRELQDAAERRNRVAGSLRGADEDARPGMMERLGVLDARIVALEREITVTGQQLTGASRQALVAAAAQDPGPAEIAQRISGDVVPIVAIVTIFFLFPIAAAIARLIWKRSVAPARPGISDQATQQRLEQLQHSVDTIAIEVERISEGQRFVTKLLNERERPALGAPVDRR